MDTSTSSCQQEMEESRGVKRSSSQIEDMEEEDEEHSESEESTSRNALKKPMTQYEVNCLILFYLERL